MACGRPVIALGRGGARETVTEATGLFFGEQTPASLAAAVRAFETRESALRPADARARALGFSRAHFLRDFAREVDTALRQKGKVEAALLPATGS